MHDPDPKKMIAHRKLRKIFNARENVPYVGPVFGKPSLWEEWNAWSDKFPGLARVVYPQYLEVFEASKPTPTEEEGR